MGVSENPILAAKRAICSISTVNWLQVDMFLHRIPFLYPASLDTRLHESLGLTSQMLVRSIIYFCVYNGMSFTELTNRYVHFFYIFISRGLDSHPLCCR